DYTNLLIDRGKKMYDACLEAGVSRLRPVLMTTLTTILGMLPMCFATSGSAGMVQPIGVAVVGGLTSSTFITLFFIPVLYSLVMKEKKREKSRLEIFLTK
ncbi:MAG: efflux RND transporter permease subunit, partial [Treponemataceae bacterium]|nr:efflux RND transporter permease subunit [Treponemataceae bacterium]